MSEAAGGGLTLESLEELAKLEVREVEVKAWGRKAHIRLMDVEARLQFESWTQGMKHGEDVSAEQTLRQAAELQHRLIAHALCEADGKLLFGDLPVAEALANLKRHNPKALDVLFEEVCKHNGYDRLLVYLGNKNDEEDYDPEERIAAAEGEAEGNSSAAQPSSSSTG